VHHIMWRYYTDGFECWVLWILAPYIAISYMTDVTRWADACATWQYNNVRHTQMPYGTRVCQSHGNGCRSQLFRCPCFVSAVSGQGSCGVTDTSASRVEGLLLATSHMTSTRRSTECLGNPSNVLHYYLLSICKT
jgi:hypothetical protein